MAVVRRTEPSTRSLQGLNASATHEDVITKQHPFCTGPESRRTQGCTAPALFCAATEIVAALGCAVCCLWVPLNSWYVN